MPHVWTWAENRNMKILFLKLIWTSWSLQLIAYHAKLHQILSAPVLVIFPLCLLPLCWSFPPCISHFFCKDPVDSAVSIDLLIVSGNAIAAYLLAPELPLSMLRYLLWVSCSLPNLPPPTWLFFKMLGGWLPLIEWQLPFPCYPPNVIVINPHDYGLVAVGLITLWSYTFNPGLVWY